MEAFLEEFQHLKIQLEEIKSATGDFNSSKIIGKGGFGVVHEGVLSHSKKQNMVAFKRLDRRHGQGDPEFWKEILMLSRYTHKNLISLLGFCDQDGEKIIVYEYASNGSLDRHLSSTSLTWKQRLKICLGAAMGLCYLHDPKETQQRVIHRDIKSSNILLDENWNAKISDMGLSKIGPANQQHTFVVSNVVGTFGYVDPMYVETSILTKESDVYSFGVVLFEVLCGRLCFENKNNHFQNLVPMWKKSFKQKKLDEIVFQDLKQHIDTRSLEVFSDTAYQCLQKSCTKRPKMFDVVEKLEIALGFQEEFEEMGKIVVPYLPFVNTCDTPPNPNIDSAINKGELAKGMMTSSSSLSATSAETMLLADSRKQIDRVGRKGRHNDTELHLAARRGNLAAVKQILDDINFQMVGPDFDSEVAEIRASIVNEVNEMGETTLYTACEMGHVEVVKELLKCSNKETISKKSLSMYDPLHVAASQGHHAVVRLLLDHDASLSHTRSVFNATPLITAAVWGHTAVVHELLLKDLSMLDIARSDGKTALHVAARTGHVEIIQTLLEKNPRMALRTDKKGQSALHVAAKGASSEVVKLLLMADPAVVMLQDNLGFTPLHAATRKKRAEIVKELLSFPHINVNALTRDHKTAFDIADGLPLSEESADIQVCLLRHGALRGNEMNQQGVRRIRSVRRKKTIRRLCTQIWISFLGVTRLKDDYL
ncbi:hypothetical protein LXL04_029143 [Taraxacum kok-saghyz]